MGGMDMPAPVRPRKGRGAASNESGRFEAERRVAFDDGWGTADEEPAPFTTTLTVELDTDDHRSQRLAGYRFRPLDQSVSRLRARLHLLLRKAEPCLSRPVSRSRFREPPVLQTRCGEVARRGAEEERVQLPADRARQQYRPLPAGRAPARHHARDPGGAPRFPPPGHDRQQIGADPARPRPPRRDGQGPSGERDDIGHDARPHSGPSHGTARLDTRAPARDDRRPRRRGDPDRRSRARR